MVCRTLSLGKILSILSELLLLRARYTNHTKLNNMIIFWLYSIRDRQPHGRCFVLHKPKEFEAEILQKYFRQSKLTSFQRQLNLYRFTRITQGQDRGGYYHELFLRHKFFMCETIVRYLHNLNLFLPFAQLFVTNTALPTSFVFVLRELVLRQRRVLRPSLTSILCPLSRPTMH